MSTTEMGHFVIYFTIVCASITANVGHIYYVLPYGASNTSCPNVSIPCFDINTYVQNGSKYFVSNSTFIFLFGDHILDTTGLFRVQSINDLALIGNSSFRQASVYDDSITYNFVQYDDDRDVTYLESLTNITCTGSSGFSFSNITNLQIMNLTITNCGVHSPQTSLDATIHLWNIINLWMEGVTIKNSTGYGLMGINIIGNSAVVKPSFIGNNQYVKYNFVKESIKIKCNDNNAANTVYNYRNSSSCFLKGGNLYIQFQNFVNTYLESSTLHLSSIVLSLGVDGSYPNCTNLTPGTGLALSLTQLSYRVYITINSTTSYRNQGQYGANFYFEAASLSNILLYNMTSKRGVSKFGSIHYYAIPSPHTITSPSVFAINNSILECNFGYLCGSLYIHIPEEALYHVDIYLRNSTLVDDASFRHSSLFVSSTNKNMNFHVTYCLFRMLQISNKDNGILHFIANSSTQLIIENSYFMYTELHCESIDVHIMNSNFSNAHATLLFSSITFNQAVSFTNASTFLNVTFGGVLSLISSKLFAREHSIVQFVNNNASYGGALFLDSLSTIIFFPQSNMSFVNNSAQLYGGAIFIQDAFLQQKCFFQFSGTVGSEINPHMYFEGNNAAEAGSVLYGGDIDHCVLDCSNMPSLFHSTCVHSSEEIFNKMTHVGFHDNSTSLISSDPTIVCYCDVRNPLVCLDHGPKPVHVYPGQEVNVSIITLGQRNGIVPGIVYVWYFEQSILNSVLRSSNQCNSYSLTVRPGYGNYTLHISTEQAINLLPDIKDSINIEINVRPCPLGFSVENTTLTCGCNTLLQQQGFICNISDHSISSSSGAKWIGTVSVGVIGVVDNCPFEYCYTSLKTVKLQNPDTQCQHDRTNTLCGQCQGNQSMMLGSSQCTSDCNNNYLLLLIPFAIMGVALVGFLVACDFTVANGTVNIFILYAFVIKMNAFLFFSSSCNRVMTILSVFIAWLNLDLGIETCFYEHLESIGKVWLQFAFSLYVAVIIGVIVLAGKISSKVSRLCRYRIIPVIATLMLLFYSKLLRTVSIIFAFEQMEISNNSYLLIWTYDGSKEYLADRSHIGLFIFGLLVTIFFIIPYTLLLLLMPCLMKLSHWRVISWINRIKPLIDSYEAPFKDGYRFWTGAMLIYRVALVIASTFIFQQPPQILLMIIIVHAGIVFSGFAVYKNWIISAMETTLHVNIIINAMTIYFLYLSDHDFPSDFHIGHCIPSTIGVGVSFLCFLVILLYNTLKPFLLWMKMKIGRLEYFRVNASPVHIPTLNEDEDEEYREPLMNE